MNTADAADDHLQAPPAPTAPGVFIARDDALNWLDTERANLVAAVKMAAATGRDQIACPFPLRWPGIQLARTVRRLAGHYSHQPEGGPAS